MKIISVKLPNGEFLPNLPGHHRLIEPRKHPDLVMEDDPEGRGILFKARGEVTLVPWASLRHVRWVDEDQQQQPQGSDRPKKKQPKPKVDDEQQSAGATAGPGSGAG